ncbi:MAG TPA: amidohydrolase, partial [Methylomirabilota bacterium]
MLDTLITGGHLLIMSGPGVGFVEGGAVGIRGRNIVAVGPRAEVEAQGPAATTIDARDRLVMPGLIDGHMHSAAVLGRGWAQEVEQWMDAAYGPLLRNVDPADAPLG